MPAMVFDLEIYTEEGGPDTPAIEVRADQRDMAAFEVTYRMGSNQALEVQTVNFLRYLGWHALRRTGQIDSGLTYQEWDLKIISVDEKDDTPPGDDQDAAPGPTDPAA